MEKLKNKQNELEEERKERKGKKAMENKYGDWDKGK